MLQGPDFCPPTPLDTCVIWPRTQHSPTWASPTPLPLPPGLGVPLPNAYFPSVSSVFYANARRCPSERARRGQSPPLHLLSLGKSPFLPAASSPGQAATPEAGGRRKLTKRKPLGVGATLLVHSPITLQGLLSGPRILGTQQPGPREVGVPPPLQVWRGEGKVKGRVPDLAAGRHGLVSRREAQWAWSSSPHDLHFAQKKARQKVGTSRS